MARAPNSLGALRRSGLVARARSGFVRAGFDGSRPVRRCWRPRGRFAWLTGAACCALLCGSHTSRVRAQPRAALELDHQQLLAAQSSALHDQTQRVVLLAPELDPREFGALQYGLAQLGVLAVHVDEAQLDPALEACNTAGCLKQMARAAACRVALVSVRNSSWPELQLSVADANGGSAEAAAELTEDGLGVALVQAWKEARLALALAGDGLLHLRSRPAGASIWLDGVPAGSTPLLRQLGPGAHRVRLELEGFAAQERWVDSEAGRVATVQLSLKRVPHALPVTAELLHAPAPVPSVWNYILGGALSVAAAPALIAALNALANDGQCLVVQEADAGMCRRRAHFGSRSAYIFALGMAALSAGGVLLFAHPIEWQPERPMPERGQAF